MGSLNTKNPNYLLSLFLISLNSHTSPPLKEQETYEKKVAKTVEEPLSNSLTLPPPLKPLTLSICLTSAGPRHQRAVRARWSAPPLVEGVGGRPPSFSLF